MTLLISGFDPDATLTASDYVVAAIKGQPDIVLKKYRPCGHDAQTGQEYSHLVSINPDFPTIDSRYVDFDIYGIAIEQKIILCQSTTAQP